MAVVRHSSLPVIIAGAIGLWLLPGMFSGSACAQDKMTVQAGFLTCRAAGGFSYILGSSRVLECTYSPKSGASEYYTGTLSKLGIDIGYLASSTLMWAVVAPADVSGSDTALAGHYAGATAGATVGLGAGINVMTGGLRNSIALQPVSVEANSGLYVGAGLATMNLEPEESGTP
jgi:Protein of unknown function (DUF992)